MNEKALEYAFGLFQQDGYTGTLDEYKELIGKNQEALDYSFDLFSNDGYSDIILYLRVHQHIAH